ncbi:DUF5994 family protein [Nocardia sp. BMG111209]|uniref:DUF5994 family protein n=1 Tax=Nocardia sp. BMG111209 TaxID=1160137 RepID=UPI00035F9D8E|nr:DUF5994 family protein [Nocardia sp. BMG111209]
MTHIENRAGTVAATVVREHPPRLLLKAHGKKVGYVDGAWWPHSDDLASELPALFQALAPRLGTIHRVTYRSDEWASGPDELVFAGRAVRLDRSRHGAAHTVEVLGTSNTRLVLLVIPPATSGYRAYTTMTSAAAPDNEATVEQLLHHTRPGHRRTGRAAALRRVHADSDRRSGHGVQAVQASRSSAGASTPLVPGSAS